MKPDATSILSFINSANKTFVIPVYQRNYSWSTEECERLFEDLLELIKTQKKHYFGNIVYYALDTVVWQGYAELALIDGQQRVTTIMLLLAALRDSIENEEMRQGMTDTYLLNDKGTMKERVKLKQIESDRDVYEAIVNGNFDEAADNNVGRNYKTFKRLIKESGVEVNDLLKAIDSLEVVALDLKLNENRDRSESPQIIFESINATGKPLSTADLLRNYLLLGVGDAEQEEYYVSYWLTIEKSIGNDNISDFINKYLVMKIGDTVNRNTEYAEFKKYLRRFDVAESEALRDLAHYAKYYAWILRPEMAEQFSKKIALKLEDLRDLKTMSMAPLVLYLLEKADSETVAGFEAEELERALLILESWGFRARISGIVTSGAFNTIGSTSLLNAVKRYEREGRTDYAQQIEYELSNYRTQDIWPDDKRFAEDFKRYNFYKTYKNYVQRKLENQISNDHKNWKPDSIEHIMPETLSADWKQRLGEDYAEIHGTYLHTIGNLTPLNVKDNSINSNDSFEKKLSQYKDSSWRLTRDVWEEFHGHETWSEDEIKLRAEALAQEARKIWRGPLARERQIEASTRKKADEKRKILADGRVCKELFTIKWDNYKMRSGETFDIDAKMRVEMINGRPHFVVLAGSRIFPYTRLSRNVNKREDELRKHGWQGEEILTRDIDLFTTPSGASDFVTSYSTNGWMHWQNEAGETLDDVVAADLEKSYEELSE